MSMIYAEIIIDFESDSFISNEQTKMFKTRLENMILDSVEPMISDLALDCGFEIITSSPVELNDLSIENDDDSPEEETENKEELEEE